MTLLGIHFVHPAYLLAAASMPFLWFFSLQLQRRRQAVLERFSSRGLWGAIIPELDWHASQRKFLLWCLTLFFFLLALARPQWGEREETVKTRGLDMMMVVDVSKSMDTEDVVPSRLTKIRRTLRYLLERMQGDRVGLVLYAGSAHLTSPLTTDLNYIRELVDESGPMSVSNQGTDIGAALEVAVRALDRGAEQLKRESESVPKTRIVLLISDGEDHEEQISEGAGKLRDADLKFYAFGVGTEKGGPIPMRDESGQNFGYKRTKKGETVISRSNFKALKDLADRLDGRFWSLGDSELEVDELVSELAALSRGEMDERRIAVKEERFQLFLALGIVFFLLELSFSLRRRIRSKAGVAAALVGVLLFPWFSEAGPAPSLRAYRENRRAIRDFEKDRLQDARKGFGKAQVEDPKSPELSFNQGVIQLRDGQFAEAIRGFQRTTQWARERGDRELEARSLYNEGIAQTQSKDLDAAAAAYIQALQAVDQVKNQDLDTRIRRNLELLLQEQQKQKQNPQNQDQGDGKDSKDSQKNPEDNQSGKNSSSGNESDSKQSQGDEDRKKQEQKDSGENRKSGKKEFRSKQLKPEDAERVMSELSRREQSLKLKLEKQRGRPQSLEKDW